MRRHSVILKLVNHIEEEMSSKEYEEARDFILSKYYQIPLSPRDLVALDEECMGRGLLPVEED